MVHKGVGRVAIGNSRTRGFGGALPSLRKGHGEVIRRERRERNGTRCNFAKSRRRCLSHGAQEVAEVRIVRKWVYQCDSEVHAGRQCCLHQVKLAFSD